MFSSRPCIVLRSLTVAKNTPFVLSCSNKQRSEYHSRYIFHLAKALKLSTALQLYGSAYILTAIAYLLLFVQQCVLSNLAYASCGNLQRKKETERSSRSCVGKFFKTDFIFCLLSNNTTQCQY